ncbi:MAG TPA: glutathione S-transferase family protein [Candidatus Binatia bacterium]|jgi:glutathione S-transferase
MLVVHHLNDSRSDRILWLLEELGLPYEIRTYQRNATTRFAPPELKAIHPLGKSPVITDGDRTIAESGAIIDYVIRRHGGGRLQPNPTSPLYDEYVQWLHYAEGSATLPLLVLLFTTWMGGGAAEPLQRRIDEEIANHLGYVERALAGREFLVGTELTGADVQMTFVAEMAKLLGRLGDYPNLSAYVARMHARPAYRRAIERGGPSMLDV